MQIKDAILPQGFTVRAPNMEDAGPVFAMMGAARAAEDGAASESGMTEEMLRSDWRNPLFNRQTDAWIIAAPTGEVVGYAAIRNIQRVRFYVSPRVHPHYEHLGIRAYLLRQAETIIQQRYIPVAPVAACVSLNSTANQAYQIACNDHELAGFRPVRATWHMQIDMLEPPAQPQWPQGIALRAFVPGQDEHAVFAATDEAFRDHWGHIPGAYAEWAHWMFQREHFDPTLWFLAYADNDIAGLSVCFANNGAGLVDDLAVLRPWRRKGLALALLLHTFGEFYRRGIPRVWLHVDAQNLTGATRLYQRAGMRVVLQYTHYQKELRPGIELSTETLTPA